MVSVRRQVRSNAETNSDCSPMDTSSNMQWNPKPDLPCLVTVAKLWLDNLWSGEDTRILFSLSIVQWWVSDDAIKEELPTPNANAVLFIAPVLNAPGDQTQEPTANQPPLFTHTPSFFLTASLLCSSDWNLNTHSLVLSRVFFISVQHIFLGKPFKT